MSSMYAFCAILQITEGLGSFYPSVAAKLFKIPSGYSKSTGGSIFTRISDSRIPREFNIVRRYIDVPGEERNGKASQSSFHDGKDATGKVAGHV